MEEELIDLEKELNELDIQEDGWENFKKWKNNFKKFIEVNESKYGWCRKEFDFIHSLKKEKGLRADDEELEIPRNTVRGYVDSYKKLFEKIKTHN